MLPYWSLYLQGEGFGYLQIALLMGSIQFTKIIAPSLWGWLGDRTGRRVRLVRLGAVLSLICFLGVFTRPGFAFMLLGMLGFSFFWNALLPLYEVITLHQLQDHRHRYGQIRLWGSIGFMLMVVVLGGLLDWMPITALPWLLLPFFVGIVLSTCMLQSEPLAAAPQHKASLKKILAQPEVRAFFLMNFLLQISLGAYYTFFSLHLTQLHYNKLDVGFFWALGVLAEILLFLIMHRVFVRFSIRQIVLCSLALTALRWLITAYWSADLHWLLFAQLLHAASYGALHSASVHFIFRYFSDGHQGQGQALYSGLTFGAGGALGAWMAGLLVQWQDTSAAFVGSTLIVLLALLVAVRGFHLND